MAHATIEKVEQEFDDGRRVEIYADNNGVSFLMYDENDDRIGYKHLAPGEVERVVSDDEVKRHILLGHTDE